VGTFSLRLSEVFCGRAFTSGRGIPSLTRHGREANINNGGSEARGTARRCEGWPSNGIRIAFRCWKDRVTYDESRYLAALAKRNSPLAAVAAGTIL
jgi:hypothetical protein